MNIFCFVVVIACCMSFSTEAAQKYQDVKIESTNLFYTNSIDWLNIISNKLNLSGMELVVDLRKTVVDQQSSDDCSLIYCTNLISEVELYRTKILDSINLDYKPTNKWIRLGCYMQIFSLYHDLLILERNTNIVKLKLPEETCICLKIMLKDPCNNLPLDICHISMAHESSTKKSLEYIYYTSFALSYDRRTAYLVDFNKTIIDRNAWRLFLLDLNQALSEGFASEETLMKMSIVKSNDLIEEYYIPEYGMTWQFE